jgi:uncharacterized repeat protein (TIGR02543 family)
MPYAVRYINADTGKRILPDKIVKDNDLSVVTETFVKVDKMMPDTYQKRLVLSANETDRDSDGIYDDNVITFYYSFDEVHAYYKVVHYIHNISSDGYREYQSVETVGTIGQSYTVKALTLTGFSFNGARTTVNGVSSPTSTSSVTARLTEEGMLIELYYDRLPYQYSVIYTDSSTGKPLAPAKTGTALFGEQVIEHAADLKALGYALSSESVKLLNVSANEAHNVIEFVYLESIVSIKYHMVGTIGGGTLSRSSENVNAVSGIPLGSAPLVSNGYLFVGWFEDAGCTRPVDESLVDPATQKFTPTKEEGSVWQENLEYYAKFIPKETKLTVMKSGWEPLDPDQIFLFRIQGIRDTETEGIDLTFTVKGNGKAVIAALPIGEYVVTELSDWAWRYEAAEKEVHVNLSLNADDNQLIFSNYRSESRWLDGNAFRQNLFH